MSIPWTPGPWQVIRDDTGGPFTGWPSVVAPEDVDRSVVHRAGFKQEYWGDWSQREAIANARLIAAAPEMAEALDNALFLLEGYVKINVPEWDGSATPDSTVGSIRALLARIRGDSA